MPVSTEVNPLECEVGRDQDVSLLLLASTQKLQHGAVVSDASLNSRILCPRRHAAKLGNQRFFGNHHGHHYKGSGFSNLLPTLVIAVQTDVRMVCNSWAVAPDGRSLQSPADIARGYSSLK
jgi:hypothetical protein